MEQSRSYRAMKTATKVMDDYYLDPILGLVPVVGDMCLSCLTLRFSIFQFLKLDRMPLQ